MENNKHKCFLCGNELIIKWDEKGYGYSTKLGVCPGCGKVVILEIIEDRWITDWGRELFEYDKNKL